MLTTGEMAGKEAPEGQVPEDCDVTDGRTQQFVGALNRGCGLEEV